MSAPQISREDLLALLLSIGVALPPNTKIPDDDLQKRLSNALDAAQQFNATFDATPVTPSKYSTWNSKRTLLDSTKRGNYAEAFQNSLGLGPTGTSTLKKDTFREMRQIVMAFANHWAEGHPNLCLMDRELKWGVFIRVLHVYTVKDVPLFVVAYKDLYSTQKNPLMEVIPKIADSNTVVSVQTTELERLGMLKLFRINAKRLAPDYRPTQASMNPGLKISFALPLGPIGMREMGRLTNDPGCELCGKTKVSRCGQCLAVSYCGQECQKLDWPNHKATCRSLKGGTWHTINLHRSAGSMARTILNRNDVIDPKKSRDNIETVDRTTVPVNIHNDKIFLVKMQISMFPIGEKANMLIYDRHKSFQEFWKRADNPDLFDDAEEMMGDSLKIYRYARRVGDLQLAICLHRSPPQNPVW